MANNLVREELDLLSRQQLISRLSILRSETSLDLQVFSPSLSLPPLFLFLLSSHLLFPVSHYVIIFFVIMIIQYYDHYFFVIL